LLDEAREDKVEDGQLGEERVNQQEMRPGAELVVFDRGGADADDGHYCSRFLAGGKSRE
jgi:hypothetical protein